MGRRETKLWASSNQLMYACDESRGTLPLEMQTRTKLCLATRLRRQTVHSTLRVVSQQRSSTRQQCLPVSFVNSIQYLQKPFPFLSFPFPSFLCSSFRCPLRLTWKSVLPQPRTRRVSPVKQALLSSSTNVVHPAVCPGVARASTYLTSADYVI